jgi:trk system potassium uptake protein TrkH
VRLILGFSLLIVIGTVLLLLPVSTPSDKTLTVTDAFFTATSAVCVTGLIVVQTPLHFTWFGELVILILFQLGGIGIVLGSTMVLLGIKGSMGMDQRFALQKTFINWPYKKVKNAFRRVFLLFFSVEILGAGILTWQFSENMEWPQALWHGIFHSVSAVCNAGFSLNTDSLIGYQDNPIVLFTISSLIIFGGLGFVVLAELFNFTDVSKRYSLHTRTMLIGTGLFLALGMVVFGLLQPEAGWLNWFFQSVTARTAGFNSVDLNGWGTPSMLMMVFLMFVGAGASSTAGGIKITTFFAALADVVSRMKQRENVHWLNRRLPNKLVNNSVVLFSVALFGGGFFTFILTITESASLEVILFEVFSALGTVGLSLGLTPELSVIGKWIIICAMFLGRLGPLTFALLIIDEVQVDYTYPEERLMIG